MFLFVKWVHFSFHPKMFSKNAPYCFLYLVYLFMIILCIALLPNIRAHAIPADVGRKIKSIPVIDKVIEVNVAPKKTIVSTDSKIVFRVV